MKSFFVLFLFLFSPWANSQACTVQADVVGTIGPANLDFIERALGQVKEQNCSSLFLRINTPGGSLQTTRGIVEVILNSPVPVLCLVAPAGAHAGSAGAIILQACHVNGALDATNIGAATPVTQGGEIPEDLRKKMINDTTSWMDAVTGLRQRSQEFGRQIITDAKAVDAKTAKKIGAIDFSGQQEAEFLNFAEGRTVKMSENVEAQVKVGPVVLQGLDLRYRVLDLLTDPQFAYMLLMGSIALIYFEITHAGAIVPGVLGAFGLVVSLISLEKLNVEYGGLALILLGIGFMVAEIFISSFGFLGLAGVASFVVGSLFLFDPATSGYVLPLSLILPTALLLAGAMLGAGYLALKATKVKKKGSYDDLMDEVGHVTSLDPESSKTGMVFVLGESWKFESPKEVKLNEKVVVVAHDGFVLKVEPVSLKKPV